MIDGSSRNRNSHPHKTLIKEVEVIKEIPVEKIVYVDRPVEVIKEVEKIVEVDRPIDRVVTVQGPERIVYVDQPRDVVVHVNHVQEHYIPQEVIRFVEPGTSYKLDTVTVIKEGPERIKIVKEPVEKIVEKEVHINHVTYRVPNLFKILAALGMVLALLLGHYAHAQTGGNGINSGQSTTTAINTAKNASYQILDASACGNKNAPAWCSGSDIGAWVVSAFTKLAGNPGQVLVDGSQASYSQTTTITIPLTGQLLCEGSPINWQSNSGEAVIVAGTAIGTSLTRISNCDFVGPGTPGSNTNIGVYLGGDPAGVITPTGDYGNMVLLDNTQFYNFNIGVENGNNVWLTHLHHIRLNANTTQIVAQITGTTNSGEEYVIDGGSVVYNGATGINFVGNGSQLRISDSSFDYQTVADLTGNINVDAKSVHFEGSETCPIAPVGVSKVNIIGGDWYYQPTSTPTNGFICPTSASANSSFTVSDGFVYGTGGATVTNLIYTGATAAVNFCPSNPSIENGEFGGAVEPQSWIVDSGAYTCGNQQYVNGLVTSTTMPVPQHVSAGPANAPYFNDFYTIADIVASGIGSPTAAGCNNTAATDVNHPGIFEFYSGTGGNNTGIACLVSAGQQLYTPNSTTNPWTWDAAVKLAALPGTTAAEFQMGLVNAQGGTPWTTGIGFIVSSADGGVTNDWQCRYGSTQTDSGVLATTAWHRLTIVQNGTDALWYVDGTQICTAVAVANLPSNTMWIGSFNALAKSSSQVSGYVDYLSFSEQVTR